jgi:hypothetical protein
MGLDRTDGFRSGHLQLLAVVLAYQDGLFVGNPKLNAYKRPDWPPL